jgi:hypothetical protein
VWLVVLAVLVVAAVVGYLSWIASRITRLETRVDAARVALDVQLERRATAVLEADLPQARDPAAAARASAGCVPEDRTVVESALTRALRTVDDLPASVASASVKVALARQFHNDAVRDLRALRSRRLVSVLRLGGTRPLPPYSEFDDALAINLSHPAVR